MRAPSLRRTRPSSTALIDLDYVDGGRARLKSGWWRAALELEPINLFLRGQDERAQIWRRYRSCLAALPGPVSIYTLSSAQRRPAVAEGVPSSLLTLAAQDSAFQAELVRDRQIHDQRHLVVVWDRGRGARDPRPEEDRGAELELRCQAVSSSLEQVGLRARRLNDGQWLGLLQGLTGGRSNRRPATFSGWLAPEQAEVGPRRLALDGRLSRSGVITGYPRRVAVGWLAPLLLEPTTDLRLAQHIYPVPKLASLSHLRRRIRSFETSLQVDHLRGHRPDRTTSAALGDALELEERVILEEERLFRMLLCITLEAPAALQLERSWQQLRTCLAEMGCTLVPLTHRQVDGWRASLPLGVDPVGWGRDMTASALATAIPFMRANLACGGGALLGPSLISRDLVILDPFHSGIPNHNIIVLGTSGAGKSYTAKLLAARLLLRSCRLRVVDPVGEYAALAELVGGTVVRLGAGRGCGLNPLGPPPSGPGAGDAALRAARALPILEPLAAGRLGTGSLPDPAAERLELALVRVLERDPLTANLSALLEELESSGLSALADRLRHFTEGVNQGLFDGPGGGMSQSATVVSLALVQQERERLLPALMHTVLAHLEAELGAAPGQPRLILVDEAEVLLRSPRSAQALESLSRRVRKLGAGLLVVSQVVEDFLNSEVGNVIIRNCHTKLLLRQEEAAIPALRLAFGLSPAECDLLRDARPGGGLVLVGRERAAFCGAAPAEWRLALSTDPRASGRLSS